MVQTYESNSNGHLLMPTLLNSNFFLHRTAFEGREQDYVYAKSVSENPTLFCRRFCDTNLQRMARSNFFLLFDTVKRTLRSII